MRINTWVRVALCLLMTSFMVKAQEGTTNTLPLVTVRLNYTNSLSESGASNNIVFDRAGGTSNLTVFYSISGAASNGVDYVEVPTSITIPAGSKSMLWLVPIDDAIAESQENIIITLKSSENYRTNSTNKVTIAILDNDNKAPTVQLFSPTNNSVFFGPTNILLKAEAHDADGSVRKVDFYRNNLLIGSVTNHDGAIFQFTWNNAEPGSYTLFARAMDNLEAKESSAPVNILIQPRPVPTNNPPMVAILTPTNNSSFTAPAVVSIAANVTDSDGYIDTVEFLVGTNSLVIITNQPEATYIANPFQYTWHNVPAGEYFLRAKATDDDGAVRISEPVFIKVTAVNPTRPIVTITTTDAEATEGATIGTVVNNASFTITRRENTNVALTVFYKVSGTASNGVDYLTIAGSVTLPSGKLSTNVLIWPVNDTAVEENETVILTLEDPVCIAVFPPPPECYLVGEARQASAVIIDDDRITNQPPVVRLLSPTNNAVFFGPLDIPLEAEASDTDGEIVRVDFFTSDKLLGTRTSPPYSMVWSNVAPASYSVSAKATDNKGAVRFSEPSKITVRSLTENSFVRRTLPLWYVPGVKVRVQLRAEPRTNTTSYVVYDTPPAGWVIQLIGEHGSMASGKITFGPFADALSRTFVYEVTPSQSETGEKRFEGSATANAISSPVIGSSVIAHAPAHPADKEPLNWNMSAEEATAYSFAWKHGEHWSLAPNPIPVNYATRAGFLFANGSTYRLSTQFPTPVAPMLWISATIETGSLTSNEEPWTTNKLGTAISSLPTNYVVGVPFTVSIAAIPADGVKAYALEEAPPLGFVITNISEGGVFSAATRKIRWGVFGSADPITVSYQLVATTNSPNVAKFAGVFSCNGINQPIAGRRETRRATVIVPARLESIKTLDDGNRLLTFQGEPGVSYILEGTTDLNDWKPIAELLNSDGSLQYMDPSTNEVVKFYRAVPR